MGYYTINQSWEFKPTPAQMESGSEVFSSLEVQQKQKQNKWKVVTFMGQAAWTPESEAVKAFPAPAVFKAKLKSSLAALESLSANEVPGAYGFYGNGRKPVRCCKGVQRQLCWYNLGWIGHLPLSAVCRATSCTKAQTKSELSPRRSSQHVAPLRGALVLLWLWIHRLGQHTYKSHGSLDLCHIWWGWDQCTDLPPIYNLPCDESSTIGDVITFSPIECPARWTFDQYVIVEIREMEVHPGERNSKIMGPCYL